ncbi:MAG TPA: hypothetical protein DCY00_02450 [Actinobacteria bacterium]|nr:hypothetical protein [Actinomycetota bacterium]
MEHKYVVTDLSLLAPWYTKHAAEPLMKFVPWWLPANIITLISNFSVLLALIVTILVTSGMFKFWLLVPALIVIYATGDILDGMQARRTKTCSKLGEYLDHFLDIFVNGMLLSMLILIYGITDQALTALYFGISYITLTCLYFEQHKNRVMFFEKIGAFEGIIILLVLFILGFIESTKQFLLRDIIGQISIFDLLLIGITFGAFYTLKRSLERAGSSANKGFVIFFLLTAATAFLSTFLLPFPAIMFVMTAYCGSHAGKLHTAYLLKQKEPPADLIFPVFLAAAVLFRMPLSIALPSAIIYQVLNIIISFMAGFYPLRKHWLWLNPGPDFVDVYTT